MKRILSSLPFLLKTPISRSAAANAAHVQSLLLTTTLLVYLGAVLSAHPSIAQCNSSSGVSTPITSTDEGIPGARMLVNGSNTTVDLTTPGKVSINVGGSSAPLQAKHLYMWAPLDPAATTFSTLLIASPTAVGTASNNIGSSGNLIKFTTSTTVNTDGGVHSAYADLQRQQKPGMACRVQMGSSITGERTWVGLAGSDLQGSATATKNCAAFRYDTSASDTSWQCVSSDNSGGTTISSSGVVVAASTTYDFAIDMSDSSKVLYYINGNLVNTVTTTLPSSSVSVGPHIETRNLVGGVGTARDISIGTVKLESY